MKFLLSLPVHCGYKRLLKICDYEELNVVTTLKKKLTRKKIKIIDFHKGVQVPSKLKLFALAGKLYL